MKGMVTSREKRMDRTREEKERDAEPDVKRKRRTEEIFFNTEFTPISKSVDSLNEYVRTVLHILLRASSINIYQYLSNIYQSSIEFKFQKSIKI